MAVNIYQAVKQAMQDLVAPQLESIKGEIVALRADTNGLRGEMRAEVNGLHGEMNGLHAEMNGLRGEMNALRGEMMAHLTRLDERLTVAFDVRERIVALEAKLAR